MLVYQVLSCDIVLQRKMMDVYLENQTASNHQFISLLRFFLIKIIYGIIEMLYLDSKWGE
jgi:hypothetical protein